MGKKGPVVIGVVVAIAVVAFVVLELWGGGGGAPATVTVTARADKTLGPDRFYYSARLTIEAQTPGADKACLAVLGRNGQVLSDVLELKAGRAEALASDLSASHFGPIWLVVLAGPGPCATARALAGAARGSDKPLDAVALAVKDAEGWRWGASRVHIHDKLP